MAEMVTGGIGFMSHNDFWNVKRTNNTNEDKYEKRWNQLKQWLIDYKCSKTNQNYYQRDVLGCYCIALSIDEIFDKMCEIEKM